MYLSNPLSPAFPYLYFLTAMVTLICLPFLCLCFMKDYHTCSATKCTLNPNLKSFAYHYSSSSSNKAILSSVRQDIHIALPSTNSALSLSICLLHQWQISLTMTKLWHASHLNVMLNYSIITKRLVIML
jgi:hypothetical protein